MMIMVWWGLICPCFLTQRKDTTIGVDPSREMNSMNSDGLIEMEKVAVSPLLVPPGSMFSGSPKPRKLESVHLNLSQVAKATQNFSPSLKIGKGEFGTIYKAHLEDGQFVAVKRARKELYQTLKTDFSSEVELLAKMDHRNLVKLLGYVKQSNELIIITEYLPNGTLREHLDGQHGKILDFKQRLEISIDVAHALTYLHFYSEKQVIHRDVNSSNILLTESLRAKVTDFGFARLGPVDSDTHISTKVRGTLGYLDPEYMRTNQLTPKSDVFSFGMLLIEILTGRRPVELNKDADQRVTLRWVGRNFKERNVMGMVDGTIEEDINIGILIKMFRLALQCAARVRVDRPDMKKVGEQLWAIRMDYLRSVTSHSQV